MQEERSEVAAKRASEKTKSRGFWPGTKTGDNVPRCRSAALSVRRILG
jgi:hypothetical protein